MPTFERGEISLYYEEFGSGYPVLLFAPGGMRSEIAFWRRSVFDPIDVLSSSFRVIAMDQRNAGLSVAPIDATGSWAVFTADHLALLDSLGIEQCHVMGGCIGSSYALAIVEAAPKRITAAVLQNPIGLTEQNRRDFYSMFDEWATALQQSRPEVSADALHNFRENMFGGEFVFSVTRDFVSKSRVPLLILAGDDNFHPTATAREIAALSPAAELVTSWKTPDVVPQTVSRVREFLQSHTPVTAG